VSKQLVHLVLEVFRTYLSLMIADQPLFIVN